MHIKLVQLLLSEHYKPARMKFDFARNVQFTKLIKVNGYLKEFNFRKSNPKPEGIFFVDVNDDRGNRIVLEMKKEAEGWKITTASVPDWIRDKETVFNELIEEELRK